MIVVFWLLCCVLVDVNMLLILLMSVFFIYRLLVWLRNVCIWLVMLLKWVGVLKMIVL